MKKNIWNAVKMSLIFILFSATAGAQTVTIDAANEYQAIRGFGGQNMPDWIGDLTIDQVDKAFGNLPGQIGLSILRIKVPTDTAAFRLQVPTALQAISNGAIVMASPWSPPAEMKTNSSLVAGSLDASHYDDYAAYLKSFVDFMANNGAPLYALSIQNEPDISVNYESCDWTPTQIFNFIKFNMVDIAPVQIIVSESYNFERSQTDLILNDAIAASKIGIIGGHIYGNGLYEYPLAESKGKDVWMTEHQVDNTSWAGALATGKEINDCMLANFNAYLWFYVRKSYSPLDEAGNITKRGYVMSQYAKFVRPGSIRVDAATSGASNIDVTAYKNDTNLVIVIVNRNTSFGFLDLTIQNDTVTELTRFTTSADKNVLNDTIIYSNDNTFRVTFEAQSVTTYTTYAGYGGSFGNNFPVANAGTDQITMDADTSGYETIQLDGSASTDSDGSVENYTWSENGEQIASGMNPSIELATGTHHIVLTVTDNDGATNTDSVVVTINLAAGLTEVYLWMEAECAIVGDNWQKVANTGASNGYYVTGKTGFSSVASASEDSAAHVIFNFDIPESGNYTIWARARVPSPDDDSFWVRMDDGTWVKWNSIAGGSTFQWDAVHNSDNGDQVMSYSLDPGNHTVTFCYREDGAGLDKLHLTNTGTIPSGEGGEADSCYEVAPPDGLIDISANNTFRMRIYPNPMVDQTTIEFTLKKAENITVTIMDLTGRILATLLDDSCAAGKNVVSFESGNLDNGIYFCKINTTKYFQINKIIISR